VSKPSIHTLYPFLGMAREAAIESSFASFSRFIIFLVLLFALLPMAPPAAAQTTHKNVLILSGDRGRVSINQMEASLRAHFSQPVNFSVVDLDNPRFEQKSFQDNLAEALQQGYSGERLDLVVAVMTTSLHFAVQYRDRVFPGVPIVFMSNISPLPEKMWPGVTGVQSTDGVRETIDLALRFHPNARTVAVISKASGPDYDWFLAEHSELLRHQEVREIDLLGPASTGLLQRVAELPPDTVVLFQLYPQDSNQPAFGALDVLADVAQRFPTYSILPHITLGRGGVAGASYDSTKDAVLAGELGARVLSGERADDIPVVQNSDVVVSVDWRQLQRWHIPESALPAGSLVLYREPTLWERGRKYFLIAIGILLLQTALILGLFWQRAARARIEAELVRSNQQISESEARFRLVANTAPVMIWMSGPDRLCTYFNQPWLEFTGRSTEAELGNGWAEGIHPEDSEKCLETYTKAFDQRQSFQMEYRLRRHDGEYRWIFDLGVPRWNADGSFAGYIGSCLDDTERKRAEEALSSVSRRLIEAHEEERTWIARELHDDVNQRIALLAVNLTNLEMSVATSDASTKQSVTRIREELGDLGSDVQALSHRLHSSKLEYLGLAAAAHGFCKEFSERHNAEVQLHCENIPRNLPPEISLCLFRVLQEAVQNALKYSGTRQFEARLEGTSSEIHLRVQDSGIGFDPDSEMHRHGLGLISMRERLKLVDGQLSIHSKPQRGTTIYACVPLKSEMFAVTKRAASA